MERVQTYLTRFYIRLLGYLSSHPAWFILRQSVLSDAPTLTINLPC